MKGLEYVKSSSLAGSSNLQIKFIDDSDYDTLYDRLRIRIIGIQNQLPVVNGEPLQPTFSQINVDEWFAR